MDCGNTIELTPVIRQTIGKSLISSELQEEELRVELLSAAVLIDLLNEQGSLWTVRVPNLEVNRMDRAFLDLRRRSQVE